MVFLPHVRRILAGRGFCHSEVSSVDRLRLSRCAGLVQALHSWPQRYASRCATNAKVAEIETSVSRVAHGSREANVGEAAGFGPSVPSGSHVLLVSTFSSAQLADGVGIGFNRSSKFQRQGTGSPARRGAGLASLCETLPCQELDPWRLRLRTAMSLASETGMGGEGGDWTVPDGGLLALNDLQDKSGARQAAKRLGRGIGSGTGKTAGRGHKGQKARSGNKPRLGFEGGQTPLRKKIPRRGFFNQFSYSFQALNLEKISKLVEVGRIDPSQVITIKTLHDAGALGKKLEDGVKLLGRGCKKFSLPINIEVSRVSDSAKAAIEAAGGSVTRVHYTRLGLRGLLTPQWFEKKGRLLPKPARPPPGLLGKVDRVGDIPGAGGLPRLVLAGPTIAANVTA